MRIKGRLLYTGWFNLPWKLVTSKGEIDLWPLVEKFFIALNGKRASQGPDWSRNATLTADKKSKFKFKYFPNGGAYLKKVNGFGGANITALLGQALVWLSGRRVEVTIEDGKQIRFTADKSEKVFGLHFTNGNLCEVPSGAEETVCKIRKPNCCIFLISEGRGFTCGKFSYPFAEMVLNRLAKDQMCANRIGKCTILGRKE